jgi:hypothetical protein
MALYEAVAHGVLLVWSIVLERRADHGAAKRFLLQSRGVSVSMLK